MSLFWTSKTFDVKVDKVSCSPCYPHIVDYWHLLAKALPIYFFSDLLTASQNKNMEYNITNNTLGWTTKAGHARSVNRFTETENNVQAQVDSLNQPVIRGTTE